MFKLCSEGETGGRTELLHFIHVFLYEQMSNFIYLFHSQRPAINK